MLMDAKISSFQVWTWPCAVTSALPAATAGRRHCGNAYNPHLHGSLIPQASPTPSTSSPQHLPCQATLPPTHVQPHTYTGFLHYTEVLEGPDGAKALGWPGFHRSHVHTSPLLYDIDADGIRDVLVTTFDGEVVFFKDNVSSTSSSSPPTAVQQ